MRAHRARPMRSALLRCTTCQHSLHWSGWLRVIVTDVLETQSMGSFDDEEVSANAAHELDAAAAPVDARVHNLKPRLPSETTSNLRQAASRIRDALLSDPASIRSTTNQMRRTYPGKCIYRLAVQ